MSAIGAVVHRQVEEVLAASGGAREVPRELLAAVAAGIDRLVVGAGPEGGLASADVAEFVTTIFLQFEAFATAIADFYSYVGAVLARPDLDGDEWLGFKSLLLDYLETIVRSVALHTPNIRRGIERLDPMLDDVLAARRRHRSRSRRGCRLRGCRHQGPRPRPQPLRLGGAARLVRRRR